MFIALASEMLDLWSFLKLLTIFIILTVDWLRLLIKDNQKISNSWYQLIDYSKPDTSYRTLVKTRKIYLS